MIALREARDWFVARFGLAPQPRWPRLTPAARAVERIVHVLDNSLPIPGTKIRIGLDPLLGLLFPAAGDAVGGVVSLGVLFLAVQYRVPTPVIGRMVWNVALDTAVGSIPIVGDVFDFGWKANDRNFTLLMQHRGDLPRRANPRYWLSVVALCAIALCCVLAPLALVVWLVLRFS